MEGFPKGNSRLLNYFVCLGGLGAWGLCCLFSANEKRLVSTSVLCSLFQFKSVLRSSVQQIGLQTQQWNLTILFKDLSLDNGSWLWLIRSYGRLKKEEQQTKQHRNETQIPFHIGDSFWESQLMLLYFCFLIDILTASGDQVGGVRDYKVFRNSPVTSWYMRIAKSHLCNQGTGYPKVLVKPALSKKGILTFRGVANAPFFLSSSCISSWYNYRNRRMSS